MMHACALLHRGVGWRSGFKHVGLAYPRETDGMASTCIVTIYGVGSVIQLMKTNHTVPNHYIICETRM